MLKKIILTLLIISLALPVYAENYIAGDVIVVIKPSSSDGAGTLSAASFASSTGAVLTKTFPALSEKNNEIFAVIHSDDANPEELSRELLKNPDVIAASPNYIVRAAAIPNDTRYSELWGMENINMPSAWDKETGSDNVYVAIVDTGIDWGNPDLTANTASELGYNALNSSSSARDDNGHGTHVAGTIGAVGNNNLGITGVNWNVKMIPVKVLDSDGYGSISSVIGGVNYVASLMSQGYNVRVVNNSLETYAQLTPNYNNLVREPLWRAFKVIDEYNRAIIVVAAGNHETAVGKPTTRTEYDGNDVLFYPGYYVYPASFTGLNNMLTVSACAQNGQVSTYSNTNANITAPGGDSASDGSLILSTWPQTLLTNILGEVSLNSIQGTSMATPHVAGAVALLAAHDNSMTAYQIKTCILESRNMNYAEGLLDVAAAIEYQEAYSSSLQREGTGGYDDWRNYDAKDNNDNNNNNNNGSDSSSGECNGFTWGAFAIIMFCPLVKKFMS